MHRIIVEGPLTDTARTLRAAREAFERAARDAADETRDRANANVSRAFGTFEDGWQPVDIETPASAFLVCTLANDADHAATLEDGRRPYPGEPEHWPPVRALVPWVELRGLTPREGETTLSVAFRVRAAIGTRGMEPRRPVGNAVDALEDRYELIFDRAAAAFVEVVS